MKNFVAMLALVLLACVAVAVAGVSLHRANQLEAKYDAMLANVSLDSEAMMQSVADSFKMNGLQWKLVWHTIEPHCIWYND